MAKYKALIIGCGNIGAMYDFENNKIQTHAKALYLNKQYEVDIFDLNIATAQKVADKYSFAVVKELFFSQYDLVSICTPTATHFQFLKECFLAKVPLVICEKPVDLNPQNLEELKNLYKNGQTQVLVNYIRRFQPNFFKLKQIIQDFNLADIQSIAINYQRGFFNNCSHAIDLLEYLFDKNLEIEDIRILHQNNDVFIDDATMVLGAKLFGKISLLINGITNINYPVFEIYIYFQYVCIAITKSGDVIKIDYSTQFNSGNNVILENSIENYMLPVIEYAHTVLEGNNYEDNFIRSIELVERMQSWIEI